VQVLEAIKWFVVASLLAAAFTGLIYLTTQENPADGKDACTAVTNTETITVTVTQTITTYVTTPTNIVIEDSSGRCGSQEKPKLEIVDKKPVNNGEGYIVVIAYSEQTNVPCYRHVVENIYVSPRNPPVIVVNLKLEPTSEICIQCVGVVETLIRIGSAGEPIPEGTEIRVNGLAVVV